MQIWKRDSLNASETFLTFLSGSPRPVADGDGMVADGVGAGRTETPLATCMRPSWRGAEA